MFVVLQKVVRLYLSEVVVLLIDPPSVCFYEVTLHLMECFQLIAVSFWMLISSL